MTMLPANATQLELALEDAMELEARLGAQITNMRGAKLRTHPPESYLQHIIIERGLGPITPYLSAQEAITEGRTWQRLRGTQAAITQALGWIDVSGTVENFPTRRRRWNNFMLAMALRPTLEVPILKDIEVLAQISTPLRSKFVRGFRTYDIRAVDYSHTRWSGVRWSSYSGARIAPADAKWSFGRNVQINRTLSESELTALGVWIPVGGAPLTWGAFTWDEAGAPWASSSALTRRRLMAAGIVGRNIWLRFSDADGVIGYRRARVARAVAQSGTGVYSVSNTRFTPEIENPDGVYLEAMTEFGEGYGRTATTFHIAFDAAIADTSKPGQQWATLAQMNIASQKLVPVTSAPLEFKRTVRERFRFMLSF